MYNLFIPSQGLCKKNEIIFTFRVFVVKRINNVRIKIGSYKLKPVITPTIHIVKEHAYISCKAVANIDQLN